MSSTLQVIAGGTCGTCVSPLQDRKSRLTTSFGIVIDQMGIIIDHGYGILNVVPEFRRRNVENVIILQTHFHMDHIAGLSMNPYFFDRHLKSLSVWAPGRAGFNDAFDQAFSEQRWPLCPPRPNIHHFMDLLDPDSLPFGIRAFALNHPGGSVAYRIPHPSGDVVIATDHEPNGITDASYARFVSGAGLLIADIQYRQSEYDGEVGIGGAEALSRRDWGHATPELLLEVLGKCEQLPRTLWVTHHDPMRPERDLCRFFEEVDTVFGNAGVSEIGFIEDGDTFDR